MSSGPDEPIYVYAVTRTDAPLPMALTASMAHQSNGSRQAPSPRW